MSLIGAVVSIDAFMAHVPGAGAAYISTSDPVTGSSSTPITIPPPGGAACPTASSLANGDTVDSFLVDSADVPAANIGSLTFLASNDFLPNLNSYYGAVLFDSAGSGYSDEFTNPPTSGETSGGLVQAAGGPFNFLPYVNNFGSGDQLSAGEFYAGVACVTPSGAVDGDNFWYAQLTFAAAATPGDFTWTLTPFTTTTTLTASPTGTAQPGAAVTLTATVTPSAADGSVTFYSGTTALQTVPLVENSGVLTATDTVGTLATGTDSLTAQFTPTTYTGNDPQVSTFGASTSSALSYQIASASTTTTSTTEVNDTTSTTLAGSSSTTLPGSTSTTLASTGTGDDPSDTSSSDSSGSTLADTGIPVKKEVLAASFILFLGLFFASFATTEIYEELDVDDRADKEV